MIKLIHFEKKLLRSKRNNGKLFKKQKNEKKEKNRKKQKKTEKNRKNPGISLNGVAVVRSLNAYNDIPVQENLALYQNIAQHPPLYYT